MDHPQVVGINLQKLEWTHFILVGGGGGVPEIPAAAPYLWTVFFKADGETLQVGADGTLAGAATVVFTPGSHGNLGTRAVSVGDPISIPPSIGQWSTTLQPIPVAQVLQGLVGKEFPATIGFVAVLMYEGHVSDHGAEAGHQALNSAVQIALANVLAKLGPGHQMVTQPDIANATAQIPGEVKNAIENAQSFWENLWSASAPDQLNDFKVVTWSQPQLAAQPAMQQFPQQFGPGWDLWRLDGSVNVVDLCALTSVRIIATRRLAASHCTKNTVVAGQECVFSAQVGGPTLPSNRPFNFSWSVDGGAITAGQMNQNASVTVDDGASQVVVSVTATNNFDCTITQSKTFPVVTPDFVARLDRICALRDEIQSHVVRLPIPVVLLHPAGPDPAPDMVLRELNRLAEQLGAETRSLIGMIGRG